MTSTAAGPPISKKEVLAWIDDACDALRESAWAPALNASELGTFDLGAALQAPLLTALLGLFDTTCEPRAQRPLWKRVLVSSKDPSYSRWRFFILEQAARFLTERPGSTSVLFWPTQPTHPPVQVPVAKVLDEMGVTTRFITNRPTLFSHLRERGVRVVCAKYVWSSKIFGARAEASRKSQVLASDPDVQLPQLANYERTCLLSVLRGAIRSNLPRIHEALATTDAIARQMEPETLVVGNDVTPEGRIACLRAQRASIPTACLLHGTVTGWPIHGFHCADKVLVYGRNSERELVDFGTDPAKIVVSGAPVLDALPNQSGETNPVLQSRLGLATGKPWILLATSGPGSTVSLSHHQRTIENVMRASAVLPQYAFVAKLHRKDE
ncbi:MAG: hypothetical protein CMJ48_01700, partial [Planctomycetaceae bacterium]|nr:hypothetical protein [Planctomycetaceae bacterium]